MLRQYTMRWDSLRTLTVCVHSTPPPRGVDLSLNDHTHKVDETTCTHDIPRGSYIYIYHIHPLFPLSLCPYIHLYLHRSLFLYQITTKHIPNSTQHPPPSIDTLLFTLSHLFSTSSSSLLSKANSSRWWSRGVVCIHEEEEDL